MMDFFKKAGVIFYVNVVACVLALVGWIMLLVTNGVETMANNGAAIALGILGVLLIGGGIFTSLKFGSQHFITAIVKMLGFVFLMLMILFLVLGRADTAAGALSYQANEDSVVKAFNTAIVSLAFSVVAAIALIVTAFFKTEKKI